MDEKIRSIPQLLKENATKKRNRLIVVVLLISLAVLIFGIVRFVRAW